MALPVYDMVVVGAGMSGIAVARFYLYVHPECRLAILEKDSHLGGVWSSRRSYEHFWTQWVVGTGEFSDTPMDIPPAEDRYFDTFKAKYTTQYLEDYVDRQVFASQSLRERIRFGFDVQSIEKLAGKWVISVKNVETGKAQMLHASKLIIATGLRTTPHIPDLPNKEQFQGQIIHQSEFGQSSALCSPHVKHVTVLGGSKSSADMVYAAIKASKSVSWIIRTPGTGPGFFLPAKGIGPYKNFHDVGTTRLVGTLSPSVLGPENWWTWLLHSSQLGAKVVEALWKGIENDAIKEAGYDRGEGSSGREFAKLKPREHLFWQNGTAGLVNHPDFWETIAPNVQVHLDSIASLSANQVQLKGGAQVPTDALLLGTGWIPSLFFFSPSLLADLDLPHPPLASPSESDQKWARLESEADIEVLARFPLLTNPPGDYFKKPNPTTPYRLYNSMVPLADTSDRSIAFVGHVTVSNSFRVSEVQAVWATAYLDGKLPLPSTEQLEREIAMFTAWCRRRYLSNGEQGNWMVFDLMAYTDKLLREVGLKSHRRGWARDYFAPGGMLDLRGVAQEYVGKFGRDGSDG